jgi:hypothetical protein
MVAASSLVDIPTTCFVGPHGTTARLHGCTDFGGPHSLGQSGVIRH